MSARCWRWQLVVSHVYGVDLDYILLHMRADTGMVVVFRTCVFLHTYNDYVFYK